MRRAGLFWKLLASFAALSLAAILTLTAVFSGAYKSLLVRELDQLLLSAAITASELLADRWPADVTDDGQAQVRQLGERVGMRLTLIDPSGRVLADSYQRDAAAVRRLESHADRAEFLTARRTGRGAARRLSPTMGERFRYQAVRAERNGQPLGVVRTALPTAPVDAQIAGLTRWIWAIGAVVALAATAIAYAIAARLTDPLRSLAEAAQALVAGRYDRRVHVASSAHDEFSAIARSLNDVGQRLAQRESQLRSTSQTQATVLEGMTESVIAVDRAEHIMFANASAGRILGFNADRVEGLTLLEAVRSHELRDVARKALRSRQLSSGEIAWRGKSQRTFDVLAAPLPGDPTPGVVLVLRDVSGLKRLERIRQQFIANVSHELKTPLSSIKAYTETLLGGARNDPDACERFLRRIDEQSGRLHQLIQDMLSLARIESGQAALEIVDVSAARVIRRCLADYEPQAAARQVALQAKVEDPALAIRADEEALRQILNNLVDNGVKYTPAGGQVIVSCRRDDAMAVLEVSDTGVGIPREHHERLFERFYRVDKARSRELGGTGLGLSIVKHLSQSMGGSVAVTSEVQRGSTFTVRLPLAAAGSAP